MIVDDGGSPLVLLETGTTDTPGTFYTGNGTSVLTFRSTVQVRLRSIHADMSFVFLLGSFFHGAVSIGSLVREQTIKKCKYPIACTYLHI